MLHVKQGGIKYHFLSLWYDSTCAWTLVSRTIGEHSTHKALTLVDTKQMEEKNSKISYWVQDKLEHLMKAQTAK